MILAGEVTVNGKIVDMLGVRPIRKAIISRYAAAD